MVADLDSGKNRVVYGLPVIREWEATEFLVAVGKVAGHFYFH